jgi:Fe-S cluster assembly iron-binding protein IscA
VTIAITPEAASQLKEHFERLERPDARVRLFIDHRCHCGKAHFTLALQDRAEPDDLRVDVAGVPFVLDPITVEEAHVAEIDFVRDDWQQGFTIRNREHNCRMHG